MAITVGNPLNIFAADFEPDKLEARILGVAGISGDLSTYWSSTQRHDYAFSGAPNGAEDRLQNLSYDRSDENLNMLRSDVTFTPGQLVINPYNQGLYRCLADSTIEYNPAGYRDNDFLATLPNNRSQVVLNNTALWERIDGRIECDAPTGADFEIDHVLKWDRAYNSGTTVSDGWLNYRLDISGQDAPSQNIYTFKDFTNGVDVIHRVPPTMSFSSDATGDVGDHFGIQWAVIGLSNRWRWLLGEETLFDTAATVKWDADPDAKITQIGASGLRNVASMTIVCRRSDGTRRFTRTYPVDGLTITADFAELNPISTDRYEVTLNGSSDSGFKLVTFGDSSIVSASARPIAGGRLGLVDYSRKTASGDGVEQKGFRDDIDLRYVIDPEEEIAVHAALKALVGRRLIWNLRPGLTNYPGFLRKFDVYPKREFSELRLNVEGLT